MVNFAAEVPITNSGRSVLSRTPLVGETSVGAIAFSVLPSAAASAVEGVALGEVGIPGWLQPSDAPSRTAVKDAGRSCRTIAGETFRDKPEWCGRKPGAASSKRRARNRLRGTDKSVKDFWRATMPVVVLFREVIMSGVWRETGRGRIGRVAVAALVATTAMVTAASAQTVEPWTQRGFLSINFGGQPEARTSIVRADFPLYEETATFESTIAVGSASLFDISGAVRVWGNFAVGLGWSRYSDTGSASVLTSVPDPLVFDAAVQATTNVPNMKHSESGVHLSAVWVLPVTLSTASNASRTARM